MSRYQIHLSVWAFLCVFVCGMHAAELNLSPAYLSYIERWKATALDQQAQYGIPASITLAQGLLESGAGQSDLARVANNHFGIKCHNDWQGKTFRKDDDQRDECFRSYQRAEDSFRDHSLFLKRPRYEVLFTYKVTDYKAWANGLKACGYATDPKYPQKLIQIIETYGLDKIEGKNKSTIAQNTPKDKEQEKPTTTPITKKDEGKKKNDEPKPKVAASADTVVWTPTNLRTKRLFAEHAYGRTNGRRFVVAQDGDSWGSFAYLFSMEEKTLQRINEAAKDQQLHGGDKLYMFPKRSRADIRHKQHTVQAGETAWFIAQYYGMRLSTLNKLNGLQEGEELRAGQVLKLR